MDGDDRTLRLRAVREKTGLGKSTIYRRMKEGTFPARVDLGGGIVGWRRSAIDEWIEARPTKN